MGVILTFKFASKLQFLTSRTPISGNPRLLSIAETVVDVSEVLFINVFHIFSPWSINAQTLCIFCSSNCGEAHRPFHEFP